ncbi:hypothetical protein K402DRAFT_460772 [Aulographum hederae CBS 113979]|uniref:t-SNARE coiled-coil homology domain-containing protein n=1 Tax=Aulographum hederae CBS 113979 TaxID=1176131 RepID=A0A6G1HA14_9PEZI|nr:hypothetical protein K402DRAFT_460772 [Aulographum hederae CBS 113979]
MSARSYNTSSTLHQRDARSALFGAYANQDRASSHSPNTFSHSPNQSSSPYPSQPYNSSGSAPGFSAYPGGGGGGAGGFRSATPNSRGQYSDAVLSELESQNDEQLEGLSGKVKMLKDITTAIGTEIRESTALAEKMNDSFEGTRVRLRGTMRRMLRMAEKTGVGWKVWLGFFAFVILLFWWVRFT